MNPITSHYTVGENKSILNGVSVTTYKMEKTGYRQKKPYNLNLPYSYYSASTPRVRDGTSKVSDAANCSIGWQPGTRACDCVRNFSQSTDYTPYTSFVSEVTAKARERFVSSMKGNAGIGVDLAERKQTVNMLETNVLRLASFSKVLRKGLIGNAAEILGVIDHPDYHKLLKKYKQDLVPSRNKRKKRFRPGPSRLITESDKRFSDLWLEFHFGWSPMIADIYDSADILQRDIPVGRIVGRAHARTHLILRAGNMSSYLTVSSHELSVDVVVGATVQMTNPNLALANQLGLINPAALVWEVVPFSFVADWFTTLGDFLGSFTEFVGYSISDPFTRTFVNDVCTYDQYFSYEYQFGLVSQCASARRDLSLPGVALKVRPYQPLSVTRCVTAIALLMQVGFNK